MRIKPLILIALSLLATTVFAQQQVEREIPRGPREPISRPIYLDAWGEAGPNGPIIHCEKPGFKCVVQATFLTAKRLTPSHDTRLKDATEAINRILASLAPPPGRKLCLYRSLYGPVLLWSDSGRDAEGPGQSEQKRPRITDPQAIADALGLTPAGKQVGGKTRKAEIIWDEGTPLWSCRNPGEDCVIHSSFAPALRSAKPSPSHDAALQAATAEIKRILDQAASRPPQPDLSLCLAFTPDGPMLAWSHKVRPGSKTVDPESPEFRSAAREALGLNP